MEQQHCVWWLLREAAATKSLALVLSGMLLGASAMAVTLPLL
jgi:hypothetical protein